MQSTSEARIKARKDLAALILDEFDGTDSFAAFLEDNGYAEVVRAIPPSTPTVYVEQLLLALDRRGRIDSDFFDLIDERVGATEHLRVIASGLGVELRERIPDEVLDNLVESLNRYSINKPEDLEVLSLGSPWYGVLAAGPEQETVSSAVRRLANDPSSESRDALVWLLDRIYNAAPTNALKKLSLEARQYLGEHQVQDAGSLSVDDDFEPVLVPILAPNRNEMIPLGSLSDALKAARSVVRVRKTGAQPGEIAGSTGWLITPSIVVAPFHILYTEPGVMRGMPDLATVAGQLVIELDADSDDLLPETLDVESIELASPSLDLAMIRMNEPLEDRQPIRIRTDPISPGVAGISIIYHKRIGPKHVSFRSGKVLRNDGHEVVYLIGTDLGSAGAPVMDDEWRVVATHRAFQYVRLEGEDQPTKAKGGTATPALLRWIRESGALGGRLWREVVAVHPDLKTVDPTIELELSEREESGEESPQTPFVVTLLDSDDSLDDIPELKVGTRSGNLVTATGTRRSLKALIKKESVLSIDSSMAAGSSECAESIPHIGADLVHSASAGSNGAGELGDQAIVAVIDNGVDMLHEAFLDGDGQTRIVAFWDQRDPNARPGEVNFAYSISEEGRELAEFFELRYGAVYAQEDVQGFVDGSPLPTAFPSRKSMAHGTRVCSIAAGRRTGDDPSKQFAGGVAPEAKLIVVRYDRKDASIGYSNGHMDALGFIDQLAEKLDLPVVVNISNGMNAGAHDGTSDVEKTCEEFTGIGKKPGRIVVKSAGNERLQKRHASLQVGLGAEQPLIWHTERTPTGDMEASDLIELWFPGENGYRFTLVPPTGQECQKVDQEFQKLSEILENGNKVDMWLRDLDLDNGQGSLRIKIFRGNAAQVEAGVWKLEIEAERVLADGPIHAWIELNPDREVRFADHTDDSITVTVPGTTENVVCVGAVQVHSSMKPHPESSYGPTRKGLEKPTIVAPGVNIRCARAGTADGVDPGGSGAASGTSFAAPHVAGAVALALSARAKPPDKMQLNARQIEQALKRTAKHFNGKWSPSTGFGELLVPDLVDKLVDIE